MTKKFTRTIENFVCDNCGTAVLGNGFTNHCPKCLYSKHVDVNPGDRAATCLGLMKPLYSEKKGTGYTLLHRCQKCGFERKNKFGEADSIDALLQLMRNRF